MSTLPLIKEPAPLLRLKAQKIEKVTPEIERLILDMAETMKTEKGVGLAAPQVGQSICLCLIATEDGPLALINPQILWKSLRNDIEEEGCLSCPNIWGLVKRSKSIYLMAEDKNGKKFSFKAKGFLARVIQHELDHLKGVLIIDKFIK